jgi:hypothetical protein
LCATPDCVRLRRASHDAAVVVAGLSRAGAAGIEDPVGARPAAADPGSAGPRNCRVGQRGTGPVRAAAGQLDLGRVGSVSLPAHWDQGERDRDAGVLPSTPDLPVPAHLPVFAGRPGASSAGTDRAGRGPKKAQAGECILLSQEEARFPLVHHPRGQRASPGRRPLGQ